MRKIIPQIIEETIASLQGVQAGCVDDITIFAQAIIGAYQKGKKLLIFGNGGSAADAQHMAAELVGRFKKERRAFAAMALTTNTSILTALANDYNYEYVFERQVEAFAEKDDIVIGISTSGNAANVIAALKKARDIGAVTAALTGAKGIRLKELCEMCIMVPSEDTPRIQEAHITIIHIICKLVEDALTS
ncbi:MAG: D-sedoheptulose 7-phosphate isomerase [Candidatus Omnitrophica bacterium]|nr:D-sedoheptulose 7-phosphate isomerase [Candidatus Omnitrophota bacterium]MBU4478342.1 D-sedoheptulose 7-phosphate isomerase [Candidatus Omnitrophota bacterium]